MKIEPVMDLQNKSMFVPLVLSPSRYMILRRFEWDRKRIRVGYA